jgi:hypothetical protein
MRTGLVRTYGERDTVQEYIDVVVKHFGLSREVRNTALRMSSYVTQNPANTNPYKSMLAMTLVNLAAKENCKSIPSNAWSGEQTCSYNTLLKHSNALKKVLEKLDEFPKLRYT